MVERRGFCREGSTLVEWILLIEFSKLCLSSSPSFILARKLKALKDDLKKWNKEEFGDLAFRKKCLLFELLGLDAREDLLGLSQEEQTRRIQIKGDIAHLASLEEISWR